MIRRLTALLMCAALTMSAAHRPAVHKPAGKRVLPIALVLNGMHLSVNPPPIFYQNRLIVPVRRILNALGLQFDLSGSHVILQAGDRTMTLTGGMEIHNTLYAPLRFFTQALGAQAVFNRQTNSVEIISTLVGNSGNGITTLDGGIEEMGTLTAVDLESAPPTITLTHNASIRTLQIRPDVEVIVQDVNTGTSNAGALEELHPGDYAQVRLDKRGMVKQVVDAYGSRTGRVAGAGSGAIVLADGHVIVPARTTTITLNGSDVSIDRIAVGDTVMVRYNIDSSEIREIIATRASTGSPPPAGPVAISSIELMPGHPLREGNMLTVTMHGTAGGRVAHYDIGPYIRNLGLKESAPGVYRGTYEVQRGVNLSNAPLFGHLRVGETEAPVAESLQTLSIATDAPGVSDFAPDNGSTVNNGRPSIYATFVPGTVDVNVSSERIIVNGHDVTSASLRGGRFIEYLPGIDYADGPVRVVVSVSDAAGNHTTKTWTFFIKR